MRSSSASSRGPRAPDSRSPPPCKAYLSDMAIWFANARHQLRGATMAIHAAFGSSRLEISRNSVHRVAKAEPPRERIEIKTPSENVGRNYDGVECAKPVIRARMRTTRSASGDNVGRHIALHNRVPQFESTAAAGIDPATGHRHVCPRRAQSLLVREFQVLCFQRWCCSGARVSRRCGCRPRYRRYFG
jgi:hypothetical protein